MNKSEHQHFIPKSYLKNFSLKKDRKYFVEIKKRTSSSPERKLISIRDICVAKNLYTFPEVEGDDKYLLEKFYAENVDKVFPEVYSLLINPKVFKISPKQRAQIIMTTMSLFFRTPKFLNRLIEETDNTINNLAKNSIDENGLITFKLGNKEYKFHKSKNEAVWAVIQTQQKITFIQNHLQAWQEFVEFKFQAGLTVYKINDDIDLITGDNPVIMHSVTGNDFNIFDPTNIISVPLDSKHYLTIFPNTEPSRIDMIFREDRDKWFALSTNLDVERNCENWIIGKPNSIKAHISDQIKYGAYTKENIEAIDMIKEKLNDKMELMKIINEVGKFSHKRVAEKVSELRKKEIYKNDNEVKKMIWVLQMNGFSTE